MTILQQCNSMAAAFAIERRIVQGCPQQVARLLQLSQKMVGVINTAYIERLNTTFRSRLSGFLV